MLETMIEYYDVSDIMHQAIIVVLLLILIANARIRIKLSSKRLYY